MPIIPKTIEDLVAAFREHRVVESWGVGVNLFAVVHGDLSTDVELWRVIVQP